jgi:hypothetical protein
MVGDFKRRYVTVGAIAAAGKIAGHLLRFLGNNR